MDKEYLLEKWLNDDLTSAEHEAFSKMEDYQMHVDILEKAKRFKASDFSEVDDFNTFNNKYQSIKSPNKTNWLYPMLRIASVLVIAISVYYSFYYNKLTAFETLAKEKITITLPDDSEVTLNALTEISFNKKKWDEKRLINLNGEAFFKVAKGKTFDVVTNDGIVTVVGTQFNVKQREDYFEVTCFEGIVRVVSDTLSRELRVGDAYRILNNEFTESRNELQKPQWTDNISSFKVVPFSKVIAELERQYNIQIIFEDVDSNRLFSGGFSHDNLDNALLSITQPMDLTYKLSTSNQVVIHGDKQ